jgi:carbon starvation protein CstA
LIGGYFTYGKVVENTFAPDDRETPAVKINDGVDYVVLPQWKLFLVQLLNIAGLGPIFGALQGALWGPIVFLWITFGTLLAGGVHDFFSGMMSERNNGESISEIAGIYLGGAMKNVMRVFSVVLLVMVGTVFAVGPAGLIVTLFKQNGVDGILATTLFWLIVILVYYFIATFLSIDKIIGKVYPVFGICLIIMAVGVAIGIFVKPEYTIPEIWSNFRSMHPGGTPVWSFMFITVACGAISGFHATQSPLMARCMKSERQGRFVFYGAMVCEGVIALIWAAAGCSLYEVTGGLNTGLQAILANGQSAAIYDVCAKTMGGIGIALAMLGVIACPITSGDTAFRSARLVLADWLKMDQGQYKNRLILCIPVLGVGAFLGIGNALGFIDYTIIWRYFSWTNQTLAMIVLWAASMYLFYDKKNYWLTAVPATFMSAVSATYFVLAPECLGKLVNTYADGKLVSYNTIIAYPIGIAVAALFLGIFLYSIKKRKVSPQYDTLKK